MDRLVTVGHWRPGDPDILIVADTGYDTARLAWMLADLPVVLVGRILRRFDLEHTFRLFKQTLGWTRPKIRTPPAADRWTWLLIAAHTQLRLARPLAADLRRPWERPAPPGRLTPARVRRGFRNIPGALPPGGDDDAVRLAHWGGSPGWQPSGGASCLVAFGRLRRVEWGGQEVDFLVRLARIPVAASSVIAVETAVIVHKPAR